MDLAAIFSSEVFAWVILPILIFVSRIFDVTLGTVRIIFVSRGKRFLAPVLGFFEVLIWLIAISQIMQHLDNFLCYIAYAAGFAMGNYVGIRLEEKLAMGILIVRIILTKDECRLKDRLIEGGYGVTSVDAHGANGDVQLIYTVIKRKDIDDVVNIINKCNSRAFFSIEDARSAYKGIFPNRKQNNMSGSMLNLKFSRFIRADRKRK